MYARFPFFNQFVILNFIFLSFYYLTVPLKALNSEQENDVNQELTNKWISVNHSLPVGFETIFQSLDQGLWPALPNSHEWRIVGDELPQLFKHNLAREHEFDFVTYTTDSHLKFNFLSRWDGTTYHSFAYTRQSSPLSSHDSARNVFPISEFTYNKQTYMRGHCIDFLDTYGLSENSKVKSGTVIESISTLDPRNYIPEPYADPSPYWGETLRKSLVAKIRHKRGCYAQYMYYGLNPTRTDDETATAIPQGIYFVTPGVGHISRDISYHVPWAYDFSPKREWLDYLHDLQDPNDFYPAPNVNNLSYQRNKDKFNEIVLAAQLPNEDLPLEKYHKLVKMADYEVDNVRGKMTLLHYLLNQNDEPTQIHYWFKRLEEHTRILYEIECHDFINTSVIIGLLAELDKKHKVDENRKIYDWLDQFRKNYQDNAKKRTTKSSYYFRPLKIHYGSEDTPIKEINVDCYSKPGLATLEVIAQIENLMLKKEPPRIRLLNLFTQRAEGIANAIKTKYPDSNIRKNIHIEYTHKKNSKTANIRSHFTTIGIIPIKREPLNSSSLKSSIRKEHFREITSTIYPNLNKKADLKNLLKTAIRLSTQINVNIVNKLEYHTSTNTIREYYIIPTVGDGDCFFHAAFTEPGNSAQDVQNKAAIMRKQLCKEITQGQYIDDFRPLIYEHYLELLTNDKNNLEVPDNIKQDIKDKNEYTEMYNNMQRFDISIDPQTTPSPEIKFPIDDIQAMIQPNHIKAYMERFRKVGGYETYIPFRPEALCPAAILAGIGDKVINFFTFDSTNKKLKFHKTAGSAESIVNILHVGDHFVRLYTREGDENSLPQAEQILQNYRIALDLL